MASSNNSTGFKLGPFIELMRVSNPVGSILVFFPHLIGALFAACYGASVSIPSTTRELVTTSLVLLPASSLLHAAGCSWNDIVDADIDRLVARTQKRPIARGAITLRSALFFTAAETLTWLHILWLLSERLFWCAMPMIILVGVYPYAKRFTDFPSVVLGVVLAYGLFLGCVSMRVDPTGILFEGSPAALNALLSLFAAYTLCVTSVDMIYAHQDLSDDLKAGVRSMAVTFRGYPKLTLAASAAAQLVLLAYAGQLMQFSGVYFAVVCGGIVAANTWMIWSVDLDDSGECWWWFQSGSILMGTVLSLGMSAEYLRLIGTITFTI